MRATLLRRVFSIALVGMLYGTAAGAQSEPIHSHLTYVALAFNETPGGQGLLQTAVAEGEVVRQHVELAAQDPTALDGIKRHVTHVLHAIDPTLVPSGPGTGYGLKQAAAGVVLHMQLAAAAESASSNVVTHATHVIACAENAAARADAIVELAREIQATNSFIRAAELLEQLDAQSSALVSGVDSDGDGRIGWSAGEGGLRQATQHMTLMMRGEGLAN
jgi:hypothetical protein